MTAKREASASLFLMRKKEMTVKECIDRVDAVKPNTYSTEDKRRWLSFIEAHVIDEIINTHEPVSRHIYDFEPFEDYDMEVLLQAKFPYDELYISYLKMKIDEENGETARYNNSVAVYNAMWDSFAKEYNKRHRPISGLLRMY